MSDRDVDAEFADIIARWDEVASVPDSADDPATATLTDSADRPPTPRMPTTHGARWTARDAPPASTRPCGRTPTPRRPGPSSSGAARRSPSPSPARRPPTRWSCATSPTSTRSTSSPGPTAPLPPQEDLQFWGIIVGLVAGPLVLLWLVLFRPDVSDWWTIGALGLTVMGFVLLVMRQPHARDEDDPDNGARL